MSKNTKDTTVDIDYADQAVPKEGLSLIHI